MNSQPTQVARRTVGEWSFTSQKEYANPFLDVVVDVQFTAPDGKTFLAPAFYDGDQTWKARFNPSQEGFWHYRVFSRPDDLELVQDDQFQVIANPSKGFVKSVPGKYWGFEYESGEPAFLLGDTVYNLFGAAHCGLDVPSFLQRRSDQGFNLLRVRLPVSPFHPPAGYSDWQTRRTWPWGGSEQAPRFDQFNLEYFQTIDRVVQLAEKLGVGLEMIMEAWGFEFPFNSRQIFVPEWEELWLRYLIARYDAFNSVYFWTPMNEYEYYPNGDWHYKPVADRWAMRIARWIRQIAPHGHILAIHNGPREPAFAQRFAADPLAIDTIMFQEWGTHSREDGWLAGGIEEQIHRSLNGWYGTAIFAEWGYERNPEFKLLVPSHEFCDRDHTRRGAWRGAFCALPVIHGFENSWGPWQVLDHDQEGIEDLLNLKEFFTKIVPFYELKPASELVGGHLEPLGYRPLALANLTREIIVVYLPVGGRVALNLPAGSTFRGRWFDPRTGRMKTADLISSGETITSAPEDHEPHPLDWILGFKNLMQGTCIYLQRFGQNNELLQKERVEMNPKPKLGLIAIAKKNQYKGETYKLLDFYKIQLAKETRIDAIIEEEVLFCESDIVHCAMEMEKRGADCIVFFVGTWIFSSIVIAAVNDIHIPFVLYGLSDQIANGNLGASLQIRYVLKEMGKKFLYLAGPISDLDNYNKMLKYLQAAWVKKSLRNRKIATIGGKCMMMYQTQVNEFNWKSVFGVDFPQYDTVQVFHEMERVNSEEAQAVAEDFLSKVDEVHWELKTGEKIAPDAILTQAKMYLAFKRLQELYQIDVFANKCMPEMSSEVYGYGYAGCLATCMLNEDGIITACEADVPAGLSMYILSLLTGQKVFFADIARLNKPQMKLTFFNCGTAPISMVNKEKGISLWPIPANISDEAVPEEYFINHMRGACINFTLEEDRTATILRIGGNDQSLRFHVARVTTTSREVEAEEVLGNRWPGFGLQFKGNLDQFMNHTTGHHYSLVYGDVVDELRFLTEILGVEFVFDE